MIAFDLTQETAAHANGMIVDPKAQKGDGSLSFSALLQSIKEGGEVIQNGALVLGLDEKEDTQTLKGSKEDTLLWLMDQSSDIEDLKLLEINPEIKSSLSPKELKQLIKDAKAYLKEKILSLDGFKRSEIKMLPKTLKGLAQVAKKLGIDVSKISLDEVRPPIKKASLTAQTADPVIKVGKAEKKEIVTDDDVIKTDSTEKKELRSHKQESSSPDVDIELDVKTKNSKKNVQSRADAEADDARVQQQSKSEQKNSTKELSSPLLFKVQKRTTISTEQIVHAKALNNTQVEMKTPKKQANNTLKQLLQGEKVTKKDASFGLTREFSVESAKVIAPSAKGEVRNSLESLLKPEVADDEKTVSKVDGLSVAKADSFEVKLNEAKQMIKYLSNDVKQAIDNYKAPFTRVKVQLNPQQLGEIEVTVVQRGKNLHVNLSSNNAAINTLAMNANDLKVQLQNSGINNASLNFSNNSQGQEQATSQQQQQQNREQAQNEYNYFDNEEKNEEILSSLEIVVPNYA